MRADQRIGQLFFNLHGCGCMRLIVTIAVAVATCSAQADTLGLEQQRALFLQAERASAAGQSSEYRLQAEQLKAYSLYPYLQFQHLQRHLDEDDAILTFIESFKSTRYARPLKQQWLVHKGKQKQWHWLIKHGAKDDAGELACYWAWAQFHEGDRQLAYLQVNQLALAGTPLAEACEQLLNQWPVSSAFQWQRFQAAVVNHQPVYAEQISKSLQPITATAARQWLSFYRSPRELVDVDIAFVNADPTLFAAVMLRWIDQDLWSALDWWEAHQPELSIDPMSRLKVERQIALSMALQRDPRAFARLMLLDSGDSVINEWRVRAALQMQDWQKVLAALDRLTAEQQNTDQWRYWRARALAESGQMTEADLLFRSVSERPSYYGLISRIRLGLPVIKANQESIAESQLATLTALPEFQAVYELRVLQRRLEANRQWRFAIESLDQQQLIAAAQLARSWNWLPMSIMTINKIREADYVELRYPLEYRAISEQCGLKHRVDPALLLAVMRQESAFDEQAESSAGAKGLMQLLPSTAKQLASQLGWSSSGAELWQPQRSICLGALYLQQLSDQFKNQYPLALAAYNAGAVHSKQWWQLGADLAVDIWIETVPYKETRQYVMAVLQNLMIYQSRLGKTPAISQPWLLRITR